MEGDEIKKNRVRRSNRTQKLKPMGFFKEVDEKELKKKVYNEKELKKKEKSNKQKIKKDGKMQTCNVVLVATDMVEAATSMTRVDEVETFATVANQEQIVGYSQVNVDKTSPVVGEICHKKFLRKKRPKNSRFVIECSEIESEIGQCVATMNVNDFKEFLQQKVVGRVEVQQKKVSVISDTVIAKRKLKFLTKKYLKKKKLHNYIRVMSSGKYSYKMLYFRYSK